MNGKIGEAMAYGIPVVTTNFGAKPFGLVHKDSAMIANNESEFIDCINQLLQKDMLRKKLVENSKKIIEKFTIEVWKESFLRSIQ